MTDTTENLTEKSDEVVEEVEVAPEADAETTEEAVVEEETEKSDSTEDIEKADDAEEVAVEEDAESEEVSEEAAEEVEKSDVANTVSEMKDTIALAFSDLAETVKSLHAEVDALKKSITGVSEEVAETKGQFDEFGKRVDAVEQDTAFRKSGDLGEIVQEEPDMVQKSLWGGRFLKTADLFS